MDEPTVYFIEIHGNTARVCAAYQHVITYIFVTMMVGRKETATAYAGETGIYTEYIYMYIYIHS